jgi:hypothetical protein
MLDVHGVSSAVVFKTGCVEQSLAARRKEGVLAMPVPALALPRFRFEGYDLSRSSLEKHPYG